MGFDEVRELAWAVLNHRLVLSYEAGLERVSAPTVVDELVAQVPELNR